MRLKRICKHAWKRLVAMALVIAMLNTSVGPVSVQAEDIGETGVDDPQVVTLDTDDANGNAGNTDGNEEPGEEAGEESGDAADTSGSAGNTETEEQGNVPAEQNVYDSGLIRIYNLEQLEAVGTGAQVYSGDDSADTFGTGDAVTDEDGNAVVYGNAAAYMLMNEISLDSSRVPRCSIDICIVMEEGGDTYRLIHKKTECSAADEYYWNKAPSSKVVRKKADCIKKWGAWHLVREAYLDIKNQYLCRNDHNHPSFVCYTEAVHRVYNAERQRQRRG